MLTAFTELQRAIREFGGLLASGVSNDRRTGFASDGVLGEENHRDYEKGYGAIQRRETHDCIWLNPPDSKVFGRHISKFGQLRVCKN